ncbi:AAA family ATPase [Anaerofustis butyriciformans]|uniref:AAA family ATPase n=1 Tax=Anaerofustis butyriciformans TaxID=3108533 RepID=UPI002E31C473|nr:AAA family ATPase [Anaerofustis sp. HA2171]
MKLKKIHMLHYRQFFDAEIHFDDDLTVLAGANNSGKTSIIELFKILFQDKYFSKDDISVGFYNEIKEKIINKINEIYDANNEVDFKQKIKETFEPNGEPVISIKIEVRYNKDESIALFSDYLMELGDNYQSFFFLFNYEIDYLELIKELSLISSKLFALKQNISLGNKNNGEYEDILIDVISKVFRTNVYFTDKNYENKSKINLTEFRKCFNYNYLSATRVLNDEKTDNHFSITKELLNQFKKSDDWDELKKQIIEHIKKSLNESKLNEKVKEHSLKEVEKSLADIENYFDYNKGEFFLQTDISDEMLVKFLSASLHTFYQFKDHIKLKEFSQGLGISNLIFMCLKIQSFVGNVKPDLVNVFVIEEPEAHMHPQMERHLINFIKDSLIKKNTHIQGIITTHSSEIIKCSDLENIRVLRLDIEKELQSNIYDMNVFSEQLKGKHERNFFSFLFSVNYSNLIFANKIIMYEGDTEKLYIEKLLLNDFKELSNQYISFVQVGGAYSHLYRKLVYFLRIKTLIITDIDYDKDSLTKEEILESKTTNAGLYAYYKDYKFLRKVKEEVFLECDKCQGQNGCFKEKSDFEILLSLLKKNFSCQKIEEVYSSVFEKKDNEDNKDKCVSNIYKEINGKSCGLIKVVTQGEKDGYSRTLEEAMLCKLFKTDVFEKKDRECWDKIIKEKKLDLRICRKKEFTEFTVRDLVNSNSRRKTDFMYSIVLNDLQKDSLPNYIEEGLNWLTTKN